VPRSNATKKRGLPIGNCAETINISPGSMGKPIPQHTIEVIDADVKTVPPHTMGEVAIKQPDPVMFLEYWGSPKVARSS
jgi:acetyl-CoA synthetase